MIVVGQECVDAQFSFDQGETSHHCIELLYWIGRTKRTVSFLKPILPADQNGFRRVLFGGLCQRRTLIGHENGILEYRKNDNHLRSVFSQNLINSTRDRTRKYCVTDDVILISGGEKCDKARNRKLEILTCINANEQQLTKHACPTLLPIDIYEDQNLLYLGQNKILLLGGSPNCEKCGNSSILNDEKISYNFKCVDGKFCTAGYPNCNGWNYPINAGKLTFEGTISSRKDNVTWKEIKSSNTSRLSSIAFKMKNYVYVAGGKSCTGNTIFSVERLNLISQCWEQTEYRIPIELNSKHISVVLSKDESEAIIFGCKCFACRNYNCNHIMTFDETKGFSFVKDKYISTQILCSYSNYVSIVQ